MVPFFFSGTVISVSNLSALSVKPASIIVISHEKPAGQK